MMGSSTASKSNVTWESRNWENSKLIGSNGLFDALRDSKKRQHLIDTIPTTKTDVSKVFFIPYGNSKKSNFERFIAHAKEL
jgi:hypothetical protein